MPKPVPAVREEFYQENNHDDGEGYDHDQDLNVPASAPLDDSCNTRLILVDNASIQKMKELEHQREKSEKRRRRRRPPPLTSSSSSLSSASSLESQELSEIPSDNIYWRWQQHDIPLTTTLSLLVFLDMFAVALVVPLLFRYFQSAGVTSAGQREILSSVFSSAQIVGGLVLGALIDAQWMRRKTVLFLSFGGSAVGYALIAYGGFSALVFSRILVGLVKQTMTITKTMLTRCTTEDNRAQHMGRLSASATAAWVFGPSVGALLFKYVDPRAPPLLACTLFVLNMILAAIVLPIEDEENEDIVSSTLDAAADTTQQKMKNKTCPEKTAVKCKTATCRASSKCQNCTISFFSNLKSCFSSSTLGSVVCASLVVTWVTRATNSSNLSSFYEELYALEPHQRGYISSYIQILGFFIESCLIAPVLRCSGGERKATCLCAILLSFAIGLQTMHRTNLTLFFGLVCPVTSFAYSIMFTSLQTLVTTFAPVDSIFSVLAAMDVLQNAVSVTVPFYRTMLFAQLAPTTAAAAAAAAVVPSEGMEGDPDPETWLVACTFHWFLAASVLAFFLLLNERQWNLAKKEDHSAKTEPKKMS